MVLELGSKPSSTESILSKLSSCSRSIELSSMIYREQFNLVLGHPLQVWSQMILLKSTLTLPAAYHTFFGDRAGYLAKYIATRFKCQLYNDTGNPYSLSWSTSNPGRQGTFPPKTCNQHEIILLRWPHAAEPFEHFDCQRPTSWHSRLAVGTLWQTAVLSLWYPQ